MADDETFSAGIADAVARVARECRGSVPPPRGAPFFGLDMGIDFDPAALASLSDPGIFRKYELVLLLGGGLGGVPRWLASSLGCRIVAVEADAALLGEAYQLNERAHMGHAVRFVAADGARLPVRDRAFTHAWILKTADRVAGDTLAAVYRALRPGGHLAVQSLTPIPAAAAGGLSDACTAAGFEASSVRRVPCAELPPVFRSARERFARLANGAMLPHAVGGTSTRPAGSTLELYQFHARRPS